ncbi:MAG: hypothetical protein ACK4VY_05515 [Brevundimonas sp.]
MLAIVFAVALQQAAGGQVVWASPAPPPPPAEAPAAADLPPLPDYARADPYGYERAECSPLIRKASETLEACQQRIRQSLAAHLGAGLPAGLAPGDAAENCRQEAAGDRYALQCGAPSRPDRPTAVLEERRCESRPRARPEGGVAWTEDCRPAGSVADDEDEGLRIRLGGRD